MSAVLVVGAGISGVAAAHALAAGGVEVEVVDRGRRVGGRMASRRIDGRAVDIGASYFTVSDPEFERVVSDWQQRGLARPWTDTFQATSDDGLVSKSGPMRWAAPAGLRDLVEDLASGLDVTERTVQAIGPGRNVDGRPYAAAVLAMPDPQAVRLLHPSYAAERAALDDPYEPVLALTATWPERVWSATNGVFVNEHADLAWIADDGQRRGDGAAVLVAHSTPQLGRRYLDQPQQAVPELVRAVREVLGIAAEPTCVQLHRWSFARPAGRREQSHFLGDALIGLCGDAWSPRPSVQAAYLSGTALGRALAEHLGS